MYWASLCNGEFKTLFKTHVYIHRNQIEAKIVLTRLLQTFKIALPPSYKLVVEQLTTQQPKGDVPCTLQEVAPSLNR